MNMSEFIIPRSDQLNYDDLLSGPRTIRITKVSGTGNPDQPVSVNFDGDQGKPWKPCKSMRRILVAAWGVNASEYVGRSVTLYGDPKVLFGGLAVGGIRISHMSHISQPLNLALTVTKAKRAPYRVMPMAEEPAARAGSVKKPDDAPVSDHVGAELGLQPLPASDNPALTTPDGEVLPADKGGLIRWRAAWVEFCGRQDLEPGYALKRLEASAWSAKGLFADRHDTCAWIESFVSDMRGRVAEKRD